MVNKNVLSCLLKDGKEVNAVMLVGRLVGFTDISRKVTFPERRFPERRFPDSHFPGKTFPG